MHVRVHIDPSDRHQDSRVDGWREAFGSFQDVVATLRDGEEVVDDLDGLARAHRDLGLAVAGLRAHTCNNVNSFHLRNTYICHVKYGNLDVR